MQHPISEQNFRPLASIMESGYTVSVEVGDLIQNKQVWHDQAIRVTVVEKSGDTKWDMFRGSKSRINAGKWLNEITGGAISSI